METLQGQSNGELADEAGPPDGTLSGDDYWATCVSKDRPKLTASPHAGVPAGQSFCQSIRASQTTLLDVAVIVWPISVCDWL